MKRALLSITALIVLAGCVTDPQGRQTFVTRERATVLYTTVNEPFEVRFQAGWAAPDFWCAAGRYADFQRMPTATRIYRLTPTPRPQGSGMTFSFAPPPGGGQPTGLATIGGSSDSLSAVGARDQCRTVRLRNDSFL